MKRLIKIIESFKAKIYQSKLLDEFGKIRKMVHGSVDIKSYINEGRKY